LLQAGRFNPDPGAALIETELLVGRKHAARSNIQQLA
jgi:hypothetical protein